MPHHTFDRKHYEKTGEFIRKPLQLKLAIGKYMSPSYKSSPFVKRKKIYITHEEILALIEEKRAKESK